MALKLKQHSGAQPLGQFDALDSQVSSFKGGEVVSFTYVAAAGSDKAAHDVGDGYVSSANQTRPAVTKTLTTGMRPLFLCDEGTTGYGTLFGELVGGAVGKVATGGTALGPHTAEGSGKVTLWGAHGLYGVTLDAVDTTASTGLAPSNTTLSGGAALYATAAGLLTPNAAAAFEAVVVARFVEFTTNGSLVNTPKHLVTARNSPAGGADSLRSFTEALVYFAPEV